jgi:hypothetical protein
MIFGGVADEHLQLNENTLYSDEPGRPDPAARRRASRIDPIVVLHEE